jgi:hypothetical protein
VTAECWRVLKPSGSLFVNLGDKYATAGGHKNGPSLLRVGRKSEALWSNVQQKNTTGVREKSLVGLPWRYAIGYDTRHLAALNRKYAPEPEHDADEAPPAPAAADVITKPGDVWILGPHRLMCGDCTKPENVAALFAGAEPELTLTDPPYCSGGFQETGKSMGSVGTAATHKQIANDRLSTRGYIALLKAALGNAPGGFAYVFTDWRMWTYPLRRGGVLRLRRPVDDRVGQEHARDGPRLARTARTHHVGGEGRAAVR